ncbi:hypothetical protein [Denitromonas halophila]|uniref:Uncharacterized protein n=1 Tax=Denitromonas halophila TaxID=1629404 RepID=A0A557QJU0_9RHOO|nr:hypothetical protein [Denitromonas halophila]TVO53171.1 hypothetical protein FHP91_15340 [Denitromonas halophila]
MSTGFFEEEYESNITLAKKRLSEAVDRCEYLSSLPRLDPEAIREEQFIILTLERSLTMDEFQRKIRSINQLIDANRAEQKAMSSK